MQRGSDQHLSAERLQAFLEGELRGSEHARAEEHLCACARCAAELDAWRSLFADLTELESLRPRHGFAERVMSGVGAPQPLPWAARVSARFGSLLAAPQRHLEPDRIQELLEGTLFGPKAAFARRHLSACSTCSREVHAWSEVLQRLDTLGRFEPTPEFAQGVMAQVRAPKHSASPVTVAAFPRALSWARALVPRSQRAWAALTGIAVTPAVTFALVIYAVFSHPTLTPSALGSFVWWKLTDLATLGWTVASSSAFESAQLFGLGALMRSAAAAPLILVGGAVVYAAFGVLALRVLQRNLLANSSVHNRYAQLSAS